MRVVPVMLSRFYKLNGGKRSNTRSNCHLVQQEVVPSLLLMLSNSWIFVSPFMLSILTSMEVSFFFAIVKVSIAKLDDISSSNETIERWNCCYVPLA